MIHNKENAILKNEQNMLVENKSYYIYTNRLEKGLYKGERKNKM